MQVIIPTYMGYGFMGTGFMGGILFDSADITATPARGPRPLTTNLEYTGDVSEITAYLWDSGDGQTSTDESPSFTYETPGVYDVSLTITVNSVQYTVTEIGLVTVTSFLFLFQNLLPRARAWTLTIEKTLRKFFESLTILPSDAIDFIDKIWFDIFPETTRFVDKWEEQFGLFDVGLTEEQRRERLAVEWSTPGGQSPRYIQDTLQANGFDVYVHEWWEDDIPTVRDPFAVLAPDNITPVAGKGYPLVNKILVAEYLFDIAAGEAVAQAGEPRALAGEYTLNIAQKKYEIPTDPDTWAYFLYIGDSTYGDIAQVPAARKNEFERLCLKICPTQAWLGMLIEYV